MVVSVPGTVASAATAHPPHLSRTLVWSAGEMIAVGAVLARGILAVEATFGSVGLVNVDDMEAMGNEEPAKPRGGPRGRITKVAS